MSAIAAKWISSFILFFSTLVVSVGPVIIFNYYLRRKMSSISLERLHNRSTAILQIFMFFGGGVLLATCFCHLMPEAKENFGNYMHRGVNHSAPRAKSYLEGTSIEPSTELVNLEVTQSPELENGDFKMINSTDLRTTLAPHRQTSDEGGDHPHEEQDERVHDVPWVEIATCAGFFFIYLIEEIIFIFVRKHSHGQVHNHSHSHDQDEQKATYNAELIDDIYRDLPHQNSGTDSQPVNPSSKRLARCDNCPVDPNTEPVNREHANRVIHPVSLRRPNLINHARLKSNTPELPASVRFMRGLVIVIAFSAHLVFDGLAIGLQSTANKIYSMLFSISMHKFVVAIAVALEIFDQTSSVYMTLVHMSLFSLMSPIGIWIVIATQKKSGLIKQDESLFFVMLSAVTTGTILYIVFFEILQKDRSGSNVNGLVLWVVMLFGFALMLFVNIFVAG